MTRNIHPEVPKARINITLDSVSNSTSRKKELPFKLLVVGALSGKENKSPLSERQRININKENFDRVIKKLSPRLAYSVQNKIKNDGSELKIDLTIEKLKDFHPDHILLKIPALTKLFAMRNLLKDLKAHLLDNPYLRRELESIVKNKSCLKNLHEELQQSAPVDL